MDESTTGSVEHDVHRLIRRRSIWRWSFSSFIIALYFCYGIGGVYLVDAYGRPFMGSSLPWGLALGYLIIFGSIVMSIVYVRAMNRLRIPEAGRDDP